MNHVFYIISIIVILLIISYGKIIRSMGATDILEKKVYDCTGCDGWAVTHFILYVLFGYLYADKHLFFLVLSIGWELIETYIGTHKIMINGKRFVLIGDQDGTGNITGDDNAWWYGRISDVAFNMLGYIIGDFYKRKIII